MKTPCKTSYGFYRLPTKVYCKLWNLTICKVFCFGQFHMSFCSQAGSQSIGFSMKIRYCFHLCQHLCQSAQTFSWRDIITYCTYINSPMFQNLYPFILRQDKATFRWKEILMSRTAIAIARVFIQAQSLQPLSAFSFICSNSCDFYTYFANRRTSIFLWVTNHSSKGLC